MEVRRFEFEKEVAVVDGVGSVGAGMGSYKT